MSLVLLLHYVATQPIDLNSLNTSLFGSLTIIELNSISVVCALFHSHIGIFQYSMESAVDNIAFIPDSVLVIGRYCHR